ncbi:Uncharacterised protein [Nocardia farcinica]|nr:Uncharacterised protein [Nocardia farcinica]
MSWRFRWGRSWLERKAAREADQIMRQAWRADLETMERVAEALRSPEQGYSEGEQAKVDAVIRRWKAAHPERARGGVTMFGPGPVGPAA